MKRFLSIIACLALCFALCVPAFATDAEVPAFPAFSSEIQSLIDEHDLKTVCMVSTGSSAFPTGFRFFVLLIQNSDDVLVKLEGYLRPENDRLCTLYRNPNKDTIYTAVFYYDTYWRLSESYGANTWTGWSLRDSSQFLISDGTTADVRWENGDVFFPVPPPLTEQLQTQAGELTQTQIVETLDFLVPLGIGLMALLISSVLLRKVFRVFL